ncbi:hypothetical protein CANCADRAFT_30699 [Tortispora caseinolytica NRRL Y-17796]|uniref:Amino acid permease/ SLC12A domain-containing protein n=1 Tax=Tortispora caseinolytica NRRL Y-17796 TaxID=767744 RepID=A0A1E4TLH9_9ASCO|nr:hypothetical protein CANCADRAFT_30699 [Tortispora caseinolytica NRRL Y-17796]
MAMDHTDSSSEKESGTDGAITAQSSHTRTASASIFPNVTRENFSSGERTSQAYYDIARSMVDTRILASVLDSDSDRDSQISAYTGSNDTASLRHSLRSTASYDPEKGHPNLLPPADMAVVEEAPDTPSTRGLQRKLSSRHLHFIALGGSVGVGLFLALGKAIRVGGPLGSLLGFFLTGCLITAVMLCLCEMVTLIPVAGGLSAFASRFIDDAVGFALGVSYWFSFAIALPTEMTAAALLMSYYPELDPSQYNPAIWITVFFVVVLSVGLLDVRVYGELETVAGYVKILVVMMLIIFNFILNQGKVSPMYEFIGFKYWNTALSEPDKEVFYGPFRPTYNYLDPFDPLKGIGGSLGRLLQTWSALSVAGFSYIGTEIVAITAGEARTPRSSLPSAIKRTFVRIVLMYVLGVFAVGLNVYAGDLRLLSYFNYPVHSDTSNDEGVNDTRVGYYGNGNCYAATIINTNFGNGNNSPWVIAMQNAGLCTLAAAMNGMLVFFAISAGSSHLYASSRTLYALAVQQKLPTVLSKCSKAGVPYVAVLVSGSFGLLAYITVDTRGTQVFSWLLNLTTTAGIMAWGGMCFAYVRFYYGLKKRSDIPARDSPHFPFRSPFQPYLAYFGAFFATLIVLLNGFHVFLKDAFRVQDFFASYCSLLLFIVCILGYKLFRGTRMVPLDRLDLDTGRREMDILDAQRAANTKPVKKTIARALLSYVM